MNPPRSRVGASRAARARVSSFVSNCVNLWCTGIAQQPHGSARACNGVSLACALHGSCIART
eukprot:2431877-Pleurochrysis_carterae.AAC.2